MTEWSIKEQFAMDWNWKIDFLVDTNILIYIMERHPHPIISHISDFSIAISIISEIELFGKKNITRHEINAARNLLKDCDIIDLDHTIKDIAISIKQKHSIVLSDAIIAATAKSLDLQLVTADKGFKKIEGVDIVILDLNC